MTLIDIGENILINPEYISSIEKNKVRGNDVIIIWVNGRSYTLQSSFEKFLSKLNLSVANDKKQYFAG